MLQLLEIIILEEKGRGMKIILKNNEEIKKQEQFIEELVKKYKSFLNDVDNWVFEKHGIHLIRPQLSYIALSVEKTWFKNKDKPKEELSILMCVAGVVAACEMLCMKIPEEIEIDEKTLKVVGNN